MQQMALRVREAYVQMPSNPWHRKALGPTKSLYPSSSVTGLFSCSFISCVVSVSGNLFVLSHEGIKPNLAKPNADSWRFVAINNYRRCKPWVRLCKTFVRQVYPELFFDPFSAFCWRGISADKHLQNPQRLNAWAWYPKRYFYYQNVIYFPVNEGS